VSICASSNGFAYRFRRKSSSSRSPSRGRSTSTSPVVPNRLPSCLVHREPSTSPDLSRGIPFRPVRRPSLPVQHRRKDEITVPLRECCQACERIIEECLELGEDWQEKFSRGARRKRSASLDHSDLDASLRPVHTNYSRPVKDFSSLALGVNEALERELEVAAQADAAASPRIGGTSTFALTVDEVDKRRKSIDFSKEDVFLPPSPATTSFAEALRCPYTRQRDASTSSDISTTSDDLSPDILDSRHRLRSSPIEEEDEAQLFPLPRRSPHSTPSRTPSPKVSPVPSPNGSTTYLPSVLTSGSKRQFGRSSSASSSKESIAAANSSQESLLRGSLSRKPPTGLSHLAVPSSNSHSRVGSGGSLRSASPSSPLATSPTIPEFPPSPPSPTTKPTKQRVSVTGFSVSKAPRTPEERAMSTPVSPTGPRLPARASSIRAAASEGLKSPKPKAEEPPTTNTPITTTSSTHTVSQTALPPTTPPSTWRPHSPFHTKSPSEPQSFSLHMPRLRSHSSTDNATSSNSNAGPTTPTIPSPSSELPSTPQRTQSFNPSSIGRSGRERSASSPSAKRKVSFTAPFLKAGGAIKGVSVDVLKGVSSMGGAGAGVV